MISGPRLHEINKHIVRSQILLGTNCETWLFDFRLNASSNGTATATTTTTTTTTTAVAAAATTTTTTTTTVFSGFVSIRMPSQVDLAIKGQATAVTGEWLEIFVLSAVSDEVGGLTEGLPAEGALVRFLPRMDVRVLLHVGFLMKALPAEVALEWPGI